EQAFDRTGIVNSVHQTSQQLEKALHNVQEAARRFTNASERQAAILQAAEGLDESATQVANDAIDMARRQANDLLEGNQLTGIAPLANQTDQNLLRNLARHIDSQT